MLVGHNPCIIKLFWDKFGSCASSIDVPSGWALQGYKKTLVGYWSTYLWNVPKGQVWWMSHSLKPKDSVVPLCRSKCLHSLLLWAHKLLSCKLLGPIILFEAWSSHATLSCHGCCLCTLILRFLNSKSRMARPGF